MAKVVFSDLPFLAEITGLSLDFLTRLTNLWFIVQADLEFDPAKVKDYCQELKTLWKSCGLQFYGHPPSVHSLIDHLPD